MIDTGSTGFMLVCAMLVLLMTPGLAFFYGGLSRRKNVVNTMVMVFGVLGIVGVVWVVCGWSFAYGGDGSLPFFGGFDQIGCLSAVNDMVAEAEGTPDAFAVLSGQGALANDPELAAGYPAIIDIVFQMAFAMITCAIITGAVAGRMKFGAVCAFVAVWVVVVYAPLAHMVWGGDGSLIGDMIGALDFAGGDVVHISSGLTGLILCLMLGRRKGFARAVLPSPQRAVRGPGRGASVVRLVRLQCRQRVRGRRRGRARAAEHRGGQRGRRALLDAYRAHHGGEVHARRRGDGPGGRSCGHHPGGRVRGALGGDRHGARS